MSKLRSGLLAVTACTVTTLVCLSLPGASGADPDATPPTVQAQVTLVVEGQIGTSSPRGDNCEGFTWGIPHRISWTAADASGLWDYNLWSYDSQGAGQDFLGWWSDGLEWPETSFTDTLGDYDGECGGGSLEKAGWGITAYDHAGNAKYVAVNSRAKVVQEDGISADGVPNPITYTGQWQTSACACASNGRQIRTSQLGATATFSAGPGEVGLVMAKGPGRGQADIFVDGVRVSTVDTRAATNANRIIVWTRTLGSGTHTIRIRNLATVGRPRIDLDAYLLSSYTLSSTP